MRVKSETRRQAILDVAAEVFRETGFEHTTMADIAARLGGSKTTLYSYFPSKEALFIETVRQSAARELGEVFEALRQAGGDMRHALQAFGRAFLRLVTSPRLVSVRRMVYASAGHSDIGKEFYACALQQGDIGIAGFLADAMQVGKLRQDDPLTAACQLRALLEATLLERCLMRVEGEVDDAEIDATVEGAVTVFLAAYGAPRAREAQTPGISAL